MGRCLVGPRTASRRRILGHLQNTRRRKRQSAPPVVVPLTAYPGFATAPSLSPDGSQVAFAWNGPNGDDFDIYVKLVGQGEPHRVTADPSTNDFRPTWSPDGRLIAFRRLARPVGSKSDVYVVPALGGGEKKLATTNQSGFYQIFGILSWSPDSKWLAYSSNMDRPGIWLVRSDGSETRQLTEPGGGPAFSTDGRYMAFIKAGQAGGLTGHVLPLTSDLKAAGPPAQVIPEFPFIPDIAWLPDDRGLIFSRPVTWGFRTSNRSCLHQTGWQRRVHPSCCPLVRTVTRSVSRERGVWSIPSMSKTRIF